MRDDVKTLMCFSSIAGLLLEFLTLLPEYQILRINIDEVAGAYKKAGLSLWLFETTEVFPSLHFT